MVSIHRETTDLRENADMLVSTLSVCEKAGGCGGGAVEGVARRSPSSGGYYFARGQ